MVGMTKARPASTATISTTPTRINCTARTSCGLKSLGGSPELKTYFINEDVTGDPATPYTPIFGTDGSSPKWKWDGKMDHNAYAVDLRCLNASNQLFTATYHLYIGDAAGNTNLAFGQTTTTWRWKGPALPVIPSLRIASNNDGVRLSWLNTVSNLAVVTATTPIAVVLERADEFSRHQQRLESVGIADFASAAVLPPATTAMKQKSFRVSASPTGSRRRKEAESLPQRPASASSPRRLQFTSLALLSLLGAIHVSPAAELATVPMQGSMLMPTVWYHEATDSVTVGLDDIIVTAQLTPLLISHPNDWFKPEDPWFESLDPSRQGLAFSRRYGFVMHAMTDYLPLDRELWIRKISSAPELSFYDYNDFVSPKTWHPIFGTADTTNATYWSGLMWHIGVTAPPSTNSYAATF